MIRKAGKSDSAVMAELAHWLWPDDDRKELAEENNCEMAKVYCYHCKRFGYNNGLALNPIFPSKCKALEKKTNTMQICKNFEFWR